MRRLTAPMFIVAVAALHGLAGAAAPPAQPVPIPAATPDELASLIGSGKWTIIEFGGEHCIPCKAMQPVLQELRDALGGKGVIRNFWIQQYPAVAREHRIMVMPTQVVINPQGEEVLRHQGYWDAAEFRAALRRVGAL